MGVECFLAGEKIAGGWRGYTARKTTPSPCLTLTLGPQIQIHLASIAIRAQGGALMGSLIVIGSRTLRLICIINPKKRMDTNSR